MRIVIICTGNTCRSPMAEALLSEKIRQAGLSGDIQVLSAGIAAGEGMPASNGAQTVMTERGLSLSQHAARQLGPAQVEAADVVLTMTPSHKRAVMTLMPGMADKIHTLAEYAGMEGEVADPFGGNVAEYRQAADQIAFLLDKAWKKIVGLAGKRQPYGENDA